MPEEKTLRPLGVERDLVANISLNLTALLDAVNAGHSAAVQTEKGTIYVNMTCFINAATKLWADGRPNDNNMSLLLNSIPDMRTREKKVYIGNGRTAEMGAGGVSTTPVEAGAGLAVTAEIAKVAPKEVVSTAVQPALHGIEDGDLPF